MLGYVIRNKKGQYLDMFTGKARWTEKDYKATVFPSDLGAENFIKYKLASKPENYIIEDYY